jgi:hypothetical protein
MREFSVSRRAVVIALLGTSTPSRCRASKASWRWWEVSFFWFGALMERCDRSNDSSGRVASRECGHGEVELLVILQKFHLHSI